METGRARSSGGSGTPPNVAGSPGFFPVLQYLRGWCALLVVISHENGFLGFPENFGRLAFSSLHEGAVFAVAIFFAISGFIIVVTSFDARAQPTTGIGAFARRRFVRIVPFLWLCTIGYNLLSCVGTGRIAWLAMLRTLVLWPLGSLKPNVAWSLRHELIFYAVAALALLPGRGQRLWLAGWALLPLLCWPLWRVWIAGGGDPRSDFASLFHLIAMGGDNGANLQFGAGALLSLWFLRHRAGTGAAIPAAIPLAIMLAATGMIVGRPLAYGVPRVLEWTVLAAFVLGLAITARPWPGLAGWSAMKLGDASFSLYLVHNPVMLIVLAASKRLHIYPSTPPELLLYLCGAVLLSVAVAVAVHFLVERPLIRAVDRRLRPRPAT